MRRTQTPARTASRACPACGEQFKVGTHHKCTPKPQPSAAISLKDLVSSIPAKTHAPAKARINRNGFYDRFIKHMKINKDQFNLLKYNLIECSCGADNCCGWVAVRPIDKKRHSVWGMTMQGQVREATTWVGPFDSTELCRGNVTEEQSTSTMEAMDRMFNSMEETERLFWERRMTELENITVTSKPLGAVEAFYSHIGLERTRSIGHGLTTMQDELTVKRRTK